MVGRGRRAALLAAATLSCAGLVCSGGPATAAPKAPAAETPAKVKVIARNLTDPREVSARGRYFYVAESGSNQVTRVRKQSGARATVVKNVPNAQGVVRVGKKIYAASGSASPGTPQVPNSRRVYVARPDHRPRTFADLLAYELKYNPDNQTQGTGTDDDTLSNPYYVVKSRSNKGFLLVADAGANDVLAVSKRGKVSTFFVPPSVSTGNCGVVPPPPAPPQNSDAGQSCDAVPTGLAYGPNGNLYVSALTGEVAGQGRVYVVDRNGKLVKTLTGFSAPTGVAVAPDGTVYVSELLQGAPEGPPPAGFDPDTVGQIVKVAPNGDRTYAQVSQPSGLLYLDGKLYASARSLYLAFLQQQKAGQIVQVDPSSFLE